MPKKDILKFSLAGIAGLLVLFFIVQSFKGKGKSNSSSREGAKNAGSSEQKTAAENNNTAGLFAKLQEETKTLEMKRDPFFKQMIDPANKSSVSSDLSLSGIVWDQDNATAIINNTIVKIGSEIAGNTVINIKEDRVILNDGVRNFELKIDQ